MKLDTTHKVYGNVLINSIKRNILDLPQSAWEINTYRQDTFSVHQKTESIIGAFTNGGVIRNFPELETYSEIFDPLINFCQGVFPYKTTVLRVMLARLGAGCTIPEHGDSHSIFGNAHRVHIPLFLPEGAIFKVCDEIIPMQEGKIIEISNVDVHTAINNSSEPRIHLICDLLPDGQKILTGPD